MQQSAETVPDLKIIRMASAAKKLGIGVSTLYTWITPSSPTYCPDFPKKVPLGGQTVGFLEHEIDAWLLKRQSMRLAA